VSAQYSCLSHYITLAHTSYLLLISYTHVGFTVSSDIRRDMYVSAVSSRATRHLNFIRRNIYDCPPEVKSLAYTSLIRYRPMLDYGTAAFDYGQ